MGIAEAFLIMSLSHGQWKMTDENVPQICLPAIEDESQLNGKAETYCTEVPQELLYKWLNSNHVKV